MLKTKFFLFALLFLAFACQNQESENKESADVTVSELVNNPSTAKTEETTEVEESKETPEGGLPILTFDETEYEFGKVYEGQKVVKVFTFKNTGSAPLLIQNAQASCGCTVPQWPKGVIKPGEGGEIKVEFNTEGKMGNQHKTVTITANTDPNTMMLNIKGEVLKGAPAQGPLAQ